MHAAITTMTSLEIHLEALAQGMLEWDTIAAAAMYHICLLL